MNRLQGAGANRATMRAVDDLKSEIAAAAARIVVEEGADFGRAAHLAARQMGLEGRRVTLPDRLDVEDAVRAHIALFCAQTQPQELRQLRLLALQWMQRMRDFRPHLYGQVWLGTATRHCDVYLQLFCDDSKAAEIALLNSGADYRALSVPGLRGGEAPAFSVDCFVPELRQGVSVHMAAHDLTDFRGALVPDARGRAPLGDVQAVQRLLQESE